MRVRCACGARAVQSCWSKPKPSPDSHLQLKRDAELLDELLHRVTRGLAGGPRLVRARVRFRVRVGVSNQGKGGWSGRAGARHLELRSDLALDLLLHRAQPVLRDARRDAPCRVEANRLACGRESGVSSSWGRPERGCAVPPEAPRGSRLRPGKRRRALSPRGSRAGRWGASWRRSKPAGLPSARISGRRKASHASGFSKSYVSSAGSIWLMVPFWSAGS